MLFSVIAAAVLIVLAVWLTAGGGKGPAPAGGIDAELAGPDVPEKVWTRRSEARIGAIETRLREMQGEARRLGGVDGDGLSPRKTAARRRHDARRRRNGRLHGTVTGSAKALAGERETGRLRGRAYAVRADGIASGEGDGE